jgi:hypothetical protein
MTESFVDYAAIKAAYAFERAVRYLGLAVERSGEQLRGACPTCKTGGPRGLAITPGKGFYCFGAKKGGDVISLVAHIMASARRKRPCSFGNSLYKLYQSRALPHVSVQDRSHRDKATHPPAAHTTRPAQAGERQCRGAATSSIGRRLDLLDAAPARTWGCFLMLRLGASCSFRS